MYRKYFSLSIAVLLFLTPVFLNAADFGFVLSQYAAKENQEGDFLDGFEYRADLLPRLSFLVGERSEFFLSAGLTLGIKERGFIIIPELLRTEFSYRIGSWGINAGRIQYADPLGCITTGLFDGVRFTYRTKGGIFGAGLWYTGLLYKKNANITMNEGEMAHFNDPVEYDSFFDTYFAPSHLLASLDWEHPSVGEWLRLKAAITGQVDLSDNGEKYHSQYLTVKAVVPVKSFVFELGGSFEVAEIKPAVNDEDFSIAFAVDFGIFWTLPTAFHSRLSLTGRYSSGQTDGTIGAFVPVTNKFYGNILKARLPGISIFTLDYTARINQSLGTSLNISYFVRNDLGTYMAYPVNIKDNTGYFLGPELFAWLVWSPVSDIHINLGGGAFLPSGGNAGQDENLRWHVEISAILALF
ncbi:MAG: hypothetical protein LBI28_07140 [Treponema sp.]|jgi:hypothetical protein|nr:hypothetical protein [Treponema sp.]